MTIALLGIPLDANSSHMFGPAKAPAAIRAVLHSGSGNHVTENGIDAVSQLEDLGDLPAVSYTHLTLPTNREV